ncbi:hypothetical protein [Pseudomonas sp.]|uniref:hypothetical protein n=1 Tax=Pseudomonas sp. TaxID=306 RepID=UPI003D6DEE37
MPADNLASKRTCTVQKTSKHANALIHKGWNKLCSPYPQALAQSLGATPGPSDRAWRSDWQVFSLTTSLLFELKPLWLTVEVFPMMAQGL